MRSIPKPVLVACAALLAFAALFFFLSGERAHTPRGEPVAAATTPEARVGSELVAPELAGPSLTDAHGSTVRNELSALAAEAEVSAPGAFVRLVKGDGVSVLARYSAKFLFGETKDYGHRWTSKESAEDGSIDLAEFTQGQPGNTEILAFPDDLRMRFDPPSLTYAELGRTRAVALRLVLRARPTAHLRGQATAQSGEPLAELALRVADWDSLAEDDPAISDTLREWTRSKLALEDSPWMVTDAEGRFESPDSYPAGRLGLITPHDERTEVTLDAEGSPVEARFRVGPLLLLDFQPPHGRDASEFIAALYRDPSEAGLGEELHDPLSPWTPADWKDVWGNAAPVHSGTPPWTRLAVEENEHPLPSFLVLVSRDGAAKGAARIDEFERHRREPLFVDVQELGALTGTVRHEGEQPRDCRLWLFGPDAPADAEALATRWTNSPGAFRFQGLAPGRYRLELRVDQRETTVRDLNVPGAEPLELVVPPLTNEERHAFEGRFTSTSGRALDGVDGRPNLSYVVARSSSGRFSATAEVKWDGGVGPFRFEKLPADEYRLYPQFARGGFEVEPEKPKARVPGDPIELRVRDEGESQRFELWIVGPSAELSIGVQASSERHPTLRIASWISPGDPLETLPDGRLAQRLLLGPYPAGAFTGLSIEADGLRTTILRATDFVVTDDLWRAEVTMSAGFSVRVLVYDEEHESVPGIVLAFDGVPLVASDAAGSIRVDAESKPERVSVVTPGWELVEHHSWQDWGTVFESGEFTIEDGILDVFLKRTR